MDLLSDRQIDRILDSAKVEMETNGKISWTTSKLLIRALEQIRII